MRTLTALACLLALGAASLLAQEYVGRRDFLTGHEIGVIRVAQDPNDRIRAYLHFAELRIELVRQLLAKQEAGRAAKIHRNIKEYGKIVEALDSVIDDALTRENDITQAIGPMAAKEKEFLAALEKIRDQATDDLWRYEFVLEDAIDITSDSIELAGESLGERRREVLEADAAEKKEREKAMSAARRAEVGKAKQEQESKEAEFKKKRPSLLKPGEKVGGPR